MDGGMVHFDLYKRSVDRWKFIDWLHTFKRKIGKRDATYIWITSRYIKRRKFQRYYSSIISKPYGHLHTVLN